jgi:hypothetical protein
MDCPPACGKRVSGDAVPSTDKHAGQAKHNEAFFAVVPKDTYSDWAATTLFYTAVQMVDAYLASRIPEIHPSNHSERDRQFATDPRLQGLWRHYRTLKDYSRDARYRPPTRFTSDFLEKQLKRDHLDPIRDSLRQAIPSL